MVLELQIDVDCTSLFINDKFSDVFSTSIFMQNETIYERMFCEYLI